MALRSAPSLTQLFPGILLLFPFISKHEQSQNTALSVSSLIWYWWWPNQCCRRLSCVMKRLHVTPVYSAFAVGNLVVFITENVIGSVITLAFKVFAQYWSQGSSVNPVPNQLVVGLVNLPFTCHVTLVCRWRRWALVPPLGILLIASLLLSNFLRLLDNMCIIIIHFMCCVSI